VNWIGANCEHLLAKFTLGLIGRDPACHQSSDRELLVLLGSKATLLPGDYGDLLSTAPFSPQISMINTNFKVFMTSGLSSNESMTGTEVFSFGAILGPSEIGPCDPVTLQVEIPSSRPLYFIWECQGCSPSSRLSTKLIKETGASVVLAPEDFFEYVDYQQLTLRVLAPKAVPPNIMLTHLIQKVPLPIPVLRANGPPYVKKTSQITVNAEGRPSSCDRLVSSINLDSRSGIQYYWNGTSISLSTLHVSMSSLEHQAGSLLLQVESESSADPRAIASTMIEIVRIPPTLRLLVKTQGKYSLLSVLYEEGDNSSRIKSTVSGAKFKWSCQDQKTECWSKNGSKLDLTDDHGVLHLNSSDFQQGVEK
jgi:hypothetical protein